MSRSRGKRELGRERDRVAGGNNVSRHNKHQHDERIGNAGGAVAAGCGVGISAGHNVENAGRNILVLGILVKVVS